MQTVINFFGSGIRYWICRIPKEEMNKLLEFREKHQLYWEDIFFDLHTLEQFGYKSWEDFHVIREGSGWLVAPRNWFEIKLGRKKRKINSEEFMGEGLMFDLFKKENLADDHTLEQETVDVLLVQLETGLVAKFELNEPRVDIDLMEFKMEPNWMHELLQLHWVEGVDYKKIPLNRVKEDTLIRENRVKLIDYEF